MPAVTASRVFAPTLGMASAIHDVQAAAGSRGGGPRCADGCKPAHRPITTSSTLTETTSRTTQLAEALVAGAVAVHSGNQPGRGCKTGNGWGLAEAMFQPQATIGSQ